MTSSPTALVTGANRGLGRSIAVALARSGHRVVVSHRPGGDADDTLREIESIGGAAIAVAIDLVDVGAFPDFADELRERLETAWESTHLDVLVANAGIGVFEPFGAVTPDSFDRVFATNVKGTFFLLQALVPLMGDGGRIVNISSSLTRHVSPATSVYAASKSAVESISRSLASELGPRGIRINTIAPGPTATDFNGGAMRDDEALRGAIASHSALGRVGDPAEIGDAVAALVSDGLRWVTAERIEVSGGAFL